MNPSTSATTQTETDIENAKLQLLSTELTGPWPLLHIRIANPLELTSTLLHFTIDIIGSVSILEIFLLTWFFDFTGITDDQWDMIISGIKWIMNLGLLGFALKTFQLALLSFLVTDATFNPIIFACAVSFGILTAASIFTISQSILEITDDYGWATFPYLMLLYWSVTSLRGGGTAEFTNDKKQKATNLFDFATEYTGFSKGTTAPISFGKFTKIFLGSMIALSLFCLWNLWNQAGQEG